MYSRWYLVKGATALVFILLMNQYYVALSSPQLFVPQEKDEYSQEFFQQHLSRKDTYDALAEVLLSSMRSLNNSGKQTSAAPEESKLNDNSISVIDVGCGHGLLVEAFRSLGVNNSYGIDGSENAAPIWPEKYVADFYKVKDLRSPETRHFMPKTDFVTSFEVAEHLPEESAADFVQLLSTHRPNKIYFGAATEWQDQGQNPSHVNEQPLLYWVEKFRLQDYEIDVASTTKQRHFLMRHAKFNLEQGWWYPKNLLVFTNMLDSPHQSAEDARNDMFHQMFTLPHGTEDAIQQYANILKGSHAPLPFQTLWKRDWIEFGELFDSMKHKLSSKQSAMHEF